MERRIRSFVDRAAHRLAAAASSTLMRARPRDPLDGFLDRVTINVSELYRNPEQYDACARRCCRSCDGRRHAARSGARAARTAPRPTPSPASSLEALPADALSRSSAPTSTAASSSARSAAASARPTCAACRRHAARRYFKPDGDGWLAQRRAAQALCASAPSDLLRDRYRPGSDLVLCRNVVIYFNEAARNHVHARARRARCGPGGHLMVGATERVADPPRMGLAARVSLHLSKGR